MEKEDYKELVKLLADCESHFYLARGLVYGNKESEWFLAMAKRCVAALQKISNETHCLK